MAHKKINLPGVSFIPDALDASDPGELIWKIEAEFVDFLKTVKDLLDIMHMIKNKHLRSTVPMPHDVLRELIKFKERGVLAKAYDKEVLGLCASVSPSVDHLLRTTEHETVRRPSMSPGANARKGKQVLRPREQDLTPILGKRQKPYWHVVVVEKEEHLPTEAEQTAPMGKRMSSKGDIWLRRKTSHKKSSIKSIARGLNQKPRHVVDPFSIKFATTSKALPTDETFMAQIEVMMASAAGFNTVAAHKRHLMTLNPHWFNDLLRDAASVGVINATQVFEAFIDLGIHFDMTCTSLPFAKAKLCYIMCSLPIWDAARLTTQRAAEFILKKILLQPKPEDDIQEWLRWRNLPYVVLPPIHVHEHYDAMMEESDKETTEKDSASSEEHSVASS